MDFIDEKMFTVENLGNAGKPTEIPCNHTPLPNNILESKGDVSVTGCSRAHILVRGSFGYKDGNPVHIAGAKGRLY